LCPPIVGSNSPSTPNTICSTSASAVTVGTAFASATAANLPAAKVGGAGAAALIAYVAGTGSPVEAGVFKAGSGAKVLDPWGHYYVYCRWENTVGSANAIGLISGGANGLVETKCGDRRAASCALTHAPPCNAFDAMLQALEWQEMAEAAPAASRRKGCFDRARESRRAAVAAAKDGAA
jgi:hypothetical protein